MFGRQDSSNVLMQTIKVPKNLLYLSDRLPKPSYSPKRDKDSEDDTDFNNRNFILDRNTADSKLPSININSGIQALK